MTAVIRRKYDEWALVTGASSGIGLAFCKLLAAKGYDLILVARSTEKMKSIAVMLGKKYSIKTHIVSADLADLSEIGKMKSVFMEFNVGLLVNNAGWGQVGVFSKHALENSLRETQLNINTPLMLTRWLLDYSKEKTKGVIFVSSIAAYMGSPYLANYSASKAWGLNFGISLYHELKNDGVDVLVVAPGPTRTGMFGMKNIDFSKAPMYWMKPEQVAKIALKRLGKKAVIIPGSINQIMTAMMAKLMSRAFAQKMFGSMMKPIMPKDIL